MERKLIWFFFSSLCASSSMCVCQDARDPKKEKTGRKLCEQAIQCTLLVCVNDKLLLQFPLYSLLSNAISLSLSYKYAFFSALAYVFGRIFFVCECEPKLLLLLFPKKMGFCRSEKKPSNKQLFHTREIRFSVDLTLLLTIIHSLILSVSLSNSAPRLL